MLPGAAFAHGGHPEAGEYHALAHLIYFGLPVALAVAGVVMLAAKKRRK